MEFCASKLDNNVSDYPSWSVLSTLSNHFYLCTPTVSGICFSIEEIGSLDISWIHLSTVYTIPIMAVKKSSRVINVIIIFVRESEMQFTWVIF